MKALKFFVPGPPVPCARPRLGARGNVYTPTKTAAYQMHVATIAKMEAYRDGWVKARSGKCVCVFMVIMRGRGQRGDIDNIAKSVLDGITKAKNVWADDRDVMMFEAHIDDQAEMPGVRVMVEAR